MRCHCEDRNACSFVCLNVLDEVFGQWSERAWEKRALDGRTRGFHPARRAPGRADDFQGGVKDEGLAKRRDDVGAIVVNREEFQFGIGLPRRKVVVGVTLQGKIAGAHGLAQNAEADFSGQRAFRGVVYTGLG